MVLIFTASVLETSLFILNVMEHVMFILSFSSFIVIFNEYIFPSSEQLQALGEHAVLVIDEKQPSRCLNIISDVTPFTRNSAIFSCGMLSDKHVTQILLPSLALLDIRSSSLFENVKSGKHKCMFQY